MAESVAAASAPAPAASAARARPAWLAPALLAAAGVACYANSARGPFLFDDLAFGLESADPLRSRPVVHATIAFNRWLSLTDTFAYHVVNVLVHVLAGLVLYGLVRRTLPRVPAAAALPARAFAFAVALVWLVHPLQTESVSYLAQRAESIAGLCYLSMLYAFARAAGSARPARWYAAVLGAFALGMGTKEIVATAPLALLFYDRTFLAGSFVGALRARAGFYAALLVAGLALFAWFIGPLLFGAETSGFGVESVSAAAYARSQAGVILHYLALCFVPRGQCLDSMWPVAVELGDWLPQTLVLGAVFAATLVALWRGSWLGFVGAWFFVTLAPSSSFVPIQDLAVEHRMYLPLAAVVVVAVAALWKLAGLVAPPQRAGAPLALACALACALGIVTVRRNRLYQSSVAMWSDVVAQAPHNWRGHLSLGMALLDAGSLSEAARELERSIELGPRPNTYLYLGRAYSRMGAHEQALRAFDQADRMRPLHAETLLDRGLAYLRKGDPRALADLERSAALEPNGTVFFNLGVAAINAGDGAGAERHFRRALEFLGESPQALGGLGRALLLQGRKAEAARELEHAGSLRPDDAELRALLEQCRAGAGQ